MTDYLAKSHPVETIKEHTDKLLVALDTMLGVYAGCLSESEIELISLASKYHDLGKANYKFQKKVHNAAELTMDVDPKLEEFYRNKTEIPHGYLSPAFLPAKELKTRLSADDWFALVNAVYYHHARPASTNSEIIDAINNDLKRMVNAPLNTAYLGCVMSFKNAVSDDKWLRYAVVKGTLNRLDYAASAGRQAEVEESSLYNNQTLAEKVETSMDKAGYSLRPVQTYMMQHRGSSLVVIASTGMGKTEAACLWAGGSKLFYTLPLKVSINAIYERLSGGKSEQYGYKKAALLHSDALTVLSELDEDDVLAKISKTRDFSYPVTICTVDQLFTFVFKHLGSEIVPAVLKYSCLVIDEIQAYSPKVVARIIYGLKLISQCGGKFAIITATMPPVLEDYMARKGIKYEKSPPFCTEMGRHWLSYTEGDFDYTHIAECGKQQKTLVICNKVDKAVMVQQRLTELGVSAHLLHGRFQQRHRRLLEKSIMDFAENGQAGIWITTQIVEASLDIDFDVLFTEMCPADSLLQRLGRCFRKREYTKSEPNVFVFDTRSGVGTVYEDSLIYDRSVECLQAYCGRIFTEEKKIAFINSVYDTTALLNSKYYSQLVQHYDSLASISPGLFSKSDAQKKFREIISDAVIDEETYLSMLNDGTLDLICQGLKSKDVLTRDRAKAELIERTIGVNPHFSKIKHDSQPITEADGKSGRPTIYRINAKYEFDEENLTGRGLLWEPPSASTMIF